MIMAEVDGDRPFSILEKAFQMLFVVAIMALGAWAVTRKTRPKNKMVERGESASAER